MRRLATVLACLTMASAPDARQAAPQVEPSRLTVIRGRVVADDDRAAPVRGARIDLVRSLATANPVFTDGDGRFALAVPAVYTLRITKAGFAPAVVSSGAAAASGDLLVRLAHGAVITGIVVDQLGFPVAGARVRARRLDPDPDAAVAGSIERTADTDDLGAYRIGSLPAGRYTLHSERAPIDPMSHPVLQARLELRETLAREIARPAPPMSEAVTVDVGSRQEATVTLVHAARAVAPPDAPIAGAVSGVVLDAFGDPAEGVVVRLWRLRYSVDRYLAEPVGVSRHTDDRGQYRLFLVLPGRYLLAATLDEPRYAPVYYPGGTDVANALPIEIGRRQETSGAAIVFTPVREARVFGFALDARGAPLSGIVSLTAGRRLGVVALPPRYAAVQADGTFELLNVPPGEYVLRAMRTAQPPASAAAPPTEFGVQRITVSGLDQAPVTIRTAPTVAIAGRVVIDGNRPGVSLPDVVLTAVADPDLGPFSVLPSAGIGIIGRVPTAQIADDGTFELRGLAGPTRFTLMAPGPWWLKSVDVGGINAADDPVVFAGRDDSRTDVTVVVSPTSGSIAGRVRDERGEPPDDFRVLVFSTNRTRWFGGSRYVRIVAGPELDGGFTLPALVPDDYWVVAVDGIEGDLESGEWQNPDVLNRLSTSARRVSVGEGQRAAIELRLVRWAR